MTPPVKNASNDTELIHVESPDVTYTPTHILAKYRYDSVTVQCDSNERNEEKMTARPVQTTYHFRTERRVPRVGLMMVGWGGNNGSTVTASILANRCGVNWRTKSGVQTPNYFGSLLLASTVSLGTGESGEDVYVPFHQLLPMAHPNDFAIGGWDINGANLAEAVERAQVLDWDLQRQLREELLQLRPLPSVYRHDFIAANQSARADNVLTGSFSQQLEQLRQDIREFRKRNSVESVIVCWTATTERFAPVLLGVNDTADNLLAAIEQDHPEVAPSTLFAVASILEHSPFINGSPQNTFVKGVLELAEREHVHIGGDDFKSGQTKVKSVLVDFLVNAGIKPLAITSYNHLGNNDGLNLSAPRQFRSKEVTKSNVIDDMVAANHILYPDVAEDAPHHVVVIKYVPAVGDTKRALDEYVSEIFMGGRSVISLYNICEDSLLAAPLIIDLVMLTELMTRVQYRTVDMDKYAPFHSVLSLLSYMLKAPLVPPGALTVNSLPRQRHALENVLRAFVGLPPQNEMQLEMRAFH